STRALKRRRIQAPPARGLLRRDARAACPTSRSPPFATPAGMLHVHTAEGGSERQSRRVAVQREPCGEQKAKGWRGGGAARPSVRATPTATRPAEGLQQTVN